jgi:hypothetical protein
MDGIFWLVLVLALLILSLCFSLTSAVSNNGQRLRSLERRVDLILKHLGIDPNQGINPQVQELMKAGQKIQAIKLYRELTGAGLKEAKDYVESL